MSVTARRECRPHRASVAAPGESAHHAGRLGGIRAAVWRTIAADLVLGAVPVAVPAPAGLLDRDPVSLVAEAEGVAELVGYQGLERYFLRRRGDHNRIAVGVGDRPPFRGPR